MRFLPTLCIRIIAATLSLILPVNDCFAHIARTDVWSDRKVVSASPPPSHRPESSALHFQALLPFGSLRGPLVAKGEPKGLILHVQDIHQNQEAQRNIGGAVDALLKSGEAGVIALEGAFGPIDLERYRRLGRPVALRKAADFLLKKNRISGPVHAALLSPVSSRVAGVDDEEHYRRNVQAYRDSMKDVARTKRDWSDRKSEIERRKAAELNDALRAFDARVKEYRTGKISLSAYVDSLGGESDLRAALQLEKSLDFAAVESERALLLDALFKRLSGATASTLLDTSASFEFYGAIESLCRAHGVDMANFPALRSYIRYLRLTARINAENLSAELKRLEKQTYDRLIQTPGERALIDQNREIYLTGKLIDFGLSKEEWNEFRRGAETPSLQAFESFYREAEARDAAMASNLLNLLTSSTKPAILVTGGFHSAGIDRRLTDAGYTVMSFIPKLSNVDAKNGSAYLNEFTRPKTSLDKFLDGDRQFLALPPDRLDALVQLMDKYDAGQVEIKDGEIIDVKPASRDLLINPFTATPIDDVIGESSGVGGFFTLASFAMVAGFGLFVVSGFSIVPWLLNHTPIPGLRREWDWLIGGALLLHVWSFGASVAATMAAWSHFADDLPFPAVLVLVSVGAGCLAYTAAHIVGHLIWHLHFRGTGRDLMIRPKLNLPSTNAKYANHPRVIEIRNEQGQAAADRYIETELAPYDPWEIFMSLANPFFVFMHDNNRNGADWANWTKTVIGRLKGHAFISLPFWLSIGTLCGVMVVTARGDLPWLPALAIAAFQLPYMVFSVWYNIRAHHWHNKENPDHPLTISGEQSPQDGGDFRWFFALEAKHRNELIDAFSLLRRWRLAHPDLLESDLDIPAERNPILNFLDREIENSRSAWLDPLRAQLGLILQESNGDPGEACLRMIALAEFLCAVKDAPAYLENWRVDFPLFSRCFVGDWRNNRLWGTFELLPLRKGDANPWWHKELSNYAKRTILYRLRMDLPQKASSLPDNETVEFPIIANKIAMFYGLEFPEGNPYEEWDLTDQDFLFSYEKRARFKSYARAMGFSEHESFKNGFEAALQSVSAQTKREMSEAEIEASIIDRMKFVVDVLPFRGSFLARIDMSNPGEIVPSKLVENFRGTLGVLRRIEHLIQNESQRVFLNKKARTIFLQSQYQSESMAMLYSAIEKLREIKDQTDVPLSKLLDLIGASPFISGKPKSIERTYIGREEETDNSGLGMAMVRMFADHFGYRYFIASGGGRTTVTLTVPENVLREAVPESAKGLSPLMEAIRRVQARFEANGPTVNATTGRIVRLSQMDVRGLIEEALAEIDGDAGEIRKITLTIAMLPKGERGLLKALPEKNQKNLIMVDDPEMPLSRVSFQCKRWLRDHGKSAEDVQIWIVKKKGATLNFDGFQDPVLAQAQIMVIDPVREILLALPMRLLQYSDLMNKARKLTREIDRQA